MNIPERLEPPRLDAYAFIDYMFHDCRTYDVKIVIHHDYPAEKWDFYDKGFRSEFPALSCLAPGSVRIMKVLQYKDTKNENELPQT